MKNKCLSALIVLFSLLFVSSAIAGPTLCSQAGLSKGDFCWDTGSASWKTSCGPNNTPPFIDGKERNAGNIDDGCMTNNKAPKKPKKAPKKAPSKKSR